MNDETNDKILAAMFRIFRTLKDSLSFDSKTSKLTMIQLEALIYLKKDKDLQMRNFADYFSTTMPTVTTLIDKLISANLATRKNDVKDRRVVKITITKLGEKIVAEAIKQRGNKSNKLLSNLSKEEKKSFLDLLQKISY